MSSSIEKAPSSPRRSSTEAPKRPNPESVLDAKKRELEKTIDAASALMEEIQQKMARGEELNQADRKSVRSFLSKLHPDAFNNTGLEETAAHFFKQYSQFSASVENRLHEQRVAAEAAQEAEAKAEQERLQQEIAKQKSAKNSPSVTLHGEPPIELQDEDFEYVDDPKAEMQRQWRVLQNREASLKEKIAAAEKKINMGDRWRQFKQWMKGEPSIGPYYQLNALKAELEEVKQQLFMYEEDQNMAKLRREAREEFSQNPPSFVKSGKRMARDAVRDAASTFMPGVESSYDRERRTFEEEQAGSVVNPENYTDVAEFEASLERDPKLAEQQRKDAQKANRDRLKQAAAKRQAEAERDERINFTESSYGARRSGPDVRTATPEERAEKARFRDMAERKMTNEEIHSIGDEFRARRKAARGNEISAEELEARIQAERQKNGWENDRVEEEMEVTDEDIISMEDAPKKTPPPTPMERARQNERTRQENRYRELLGNRASEVMGTIDSLFAQMSPAEASKLGFSRDQYLDFASGLMQSATENWKDEKSGYTSDDYFKLAQRKLAEYNKKLGLPPDFVTGFGGSRPNKMSGLGGNSARAEISREANRIAGAPISERSSVGRRSSGKSEVLDQPVERTKEPEEFDVDLSDLEKGPLDERFEARVKETADSIGREKADAIWKRINQAIAQNQEKIKALNNYDYLNYRGGTDYVLNRLPNVKDRNLETALTVAIAELVKGTQDRQLEGKVMGTLATLGISREEISSILYPPEKGFSAEKRKGVVRNVSDRNRRENSRRYGGSTATGM